MWLRNKKTGGLFNTDDIKGNYIKKLNDISKREYENKIDKTEYDKEVRKATEEYKRDKENYLKNSNYLKNLKEKEKMEKMGTTAYLMEKERNRGNFNDAKVDTLQQKANKVVKNLSKNNYEVKYNSVSEVIADRDSKLNRYINSKTPLEKMTRQQLAEYIVDDQISRGIVKEANRTMQVQGRLKGMGAMKGMSKKELYLGAKDTQLAKMSLSELVKTAQKYNIDTKGLNAQQLRAKLIAIFK